MNKKGDYITGAIIPKDIYKIAEGIKQKAEITKMDAMRIMTNMTPIIERIEKEPIRNTKKERLVIFGKWVFEL